MLKMMRSSSKNTHLHIEYPWLALRALINFFQETGQAKKPGI
jgi:hypothetical protein